MAEPSETETATSSETTEPEYSGFSEGDLGRLQGILFGDHAKQTHERIDTLERALLGAMRDLKAELTAQIATLDKRVEAEENNRSTAVANLTDRVATEAKTASGATKKLQQQVDKSTDKLTKAIEEAVTDQRLELDATRRDLTAELEATASQLSDQAVDRKSLATALMGIAEELNR